MLEYGLLDVYVGLWFLVWVIWFNALYFGFGLSFVYRFGF